MNFGQSYICLNWVSGVLQPSGKNSWIRNVLFYDYKLSNHDQPCLFVHFDPTLHARTPHMVAASSRKPASKQQNHWSGPCERGRVKQWMIKCLGFCEAVWIRLRNEKPTVTSNVRCKIRVVLFQRVVVGVGGSDFIGKRPRGTRGTSGAPRSWWAPSPTGWPNKSITQNTNYQKKQ